MHRDSFSTKLLVVQGTLIMTIDKEFTTSVYCTAKKRTIFTL